MKKIIIILIVIIVLAVIGTFVYTQYFAAAPASPVGPTTSNEPSALVPPVATTSVPVSPVGVASSSPTIAIGTPAGTVIVKNFYVTTLGQDEEYITFAQTQSYVLLYNTDNSSFVVSISAGPLSVTRPAAEQALLSTLGVSQTDACKLNVTVGVEPSVDPAYANQALPLSFCSGSVLR